MNIPPYLKNGDHIGIVCPASAINTNIDDAIAEIESWGLKPVLGETVTSKLHQFAGDDFLRATDFQKMLDNKEIKAIIAARGGYGSVRIIDRINFSSFIMKPKWMVGFSDITIFHSHFHQVLHTATIHGQMPISMHDSKAETLETLRKALMGEPLSYEAESHPMSSIADCEGVLVGGNLSILISTMGSISELNYNNKILFIEDVGEQYYAVDRMLWTLKRAGRLAKLKGLIVGGFTSMKDNESNSFGYTIPEIVSEIVKDYGYPVYYDFPAGHQENNQALIFGKKIRMKNDGKLTQGSYA